MRNLLMLLLLCSSATAADFVYEGTWVTTNRRLDGKMTCEVIQTGKEAWSGKFYGVWQGEPFRYTVPFTGPANNLKGKARIGGAHYTWSAKIDRHSPGKFTGMFTGNRYTGYFKLKQKVPQRK